MTITETESIMITEPIFDNGVHKELPLEPHNLELRIQNIQDLYAIQAIIQEEDERNLSIDEVLARVITLYGMHVPFQKTQQPKKFEAESSIKIDLII